MKKFAPIGFVLAGAAFMVPPVMAKIAGEPANGAFIVIGIAFFIIAAGLHAQGRNKSGNPPASPGR